jgi:hypothetical protein
MNHSIASSINMTNTNKPYSTPVLKSAGNLAELTQGFAGSVPDEQGGHTKRNPFQG